MSNYILIPMFLEHYTLIKRVGFLDGFDSSMNLYLLSRTIYEFEMYKMYVSF